MAQCFQKEKTKVVQLTTSYRSTQQMTDFTKEVLVNGEKVTAFERNGEKPTIIVDQDKAALVNDVVDILAKNDAAKQTTAIIGKSLAECEALFTLLQAKRCPNDFDPDGKSTVSSWNFDRTFLFS